MVSEEIKRGIELLDKRAPGKDWRTLINKNRLDLRLCHRCILGQLFGYYDKGISLLGLESDYYKGREEAVNLGFALPFESGEQGYNELTNQWKQALSKEQQP